MTRYLVVRLGSCLLLFFAITLCVFVAFSLLPRDDGGRRGGRAGDAYRIHGSLPGQYGRYVWNLVRGDLGSSYANREPVAERVARAVPVTLSLVLGGLLLWLVVAVPLGVLAALRPRSLLDRATTVFVLLGISAHPVWLGLVLSWLLGQHWHVFPSTGYCDLFSPSTRCGGPAQWIDHLFLPWVVFGLVTAAVYTLMIRSIVHEQLDHDYVRTARAKGAGDGRIVCTHVLKNALLPVVTMVGMNAGVALGGVIFVESVFGLPGLGGMFRRAILQRDVPVTAGIVVFSALAIMLLNLLVDLAYAALDPRIRVSTPTPQSAWAPQTSSQTTR
jgi:peptide/nickel transport system permease protein